MTYWGYMMLKCMISSFIKHMCNKFPLMVELSHGKQVLYETTKRCHRKTCSAVSRCFEILQWSNIHDQAVLVRVRGAQNGQWLLIRLLSICSQFFISQKIQGNEQWKTASESTFVWDWCIKTEYSFAKSIGKKCVVNYDIRTPRTEISISFSLIIFLNCKC